MRQNNFLINTVFRDITFFGSFVFCGVALLVIAILNFGLFVRSALTLAAVEAVCGAIKLAYQKERPLPERKDTELPQLLQKWSSNSFPSVHSARAAALAVSLLNLYMHDKMLVGVVVITIGALGYSRIYLKKHYWIDVVAGLAIGVFFGIIGMKILNWE